MTIEITAEVMLERGARIIAERDGVPVITTDAGRNDEHFRKAVRAWIETPAGKAWVNEQRPRARLVDR